MWLSEVRKVLPILERCKILPLRTNKTYFSVSANRTLNDPVAQPNQTESVTKRQTHPESLGLDIKQRFPLINETDFKSFIKEYPAVVQDVLSLKELEGITMMSDWIRKSMDYNVPYGKLIRPVLLLAIAMKTQERTGVDLPNLNRIAWTYELVQTSAVIMDDIVDRSITRRDMPCWYLLENVGIYNAINTGVRLQTTMFVLMMQYAKGHYPLYTEILEVLLKNSLTMWYAQELDGRISTGKEFQPVSIDTYTRMMTAKNGSYTFYATIMLGLLLNGINDPQINSKIDRISLGLGLLYSVQDDFLDCFVDPSKTGKIGTDIQDGKPSWLIVKAMEMASKGQRKILSDNYGNIDPGKSAAVKAMYEELGLPEAFREFEKKTIFSLLLQIEELPELVPKEVLKQLVGILNGRTR